MILTVTWAGSAYAQPYRLPESTTVEIDGERHEAFDLGGFSALLKLDVDYEFALRELRLREEQVQLSISIIDDLTRAMALAIEQRELLREDRDLMEERWREENKKRHEAENRPRLGNPIAWTTAAVAAVVAAVLGVVLGVSR